MRFQGFKIITLMDGKYRVIEEKGRRETPKIWGPYSGFPKRVEAQRLLEEIQKDKRRHGY